MRNDDLPADHRHPGGITTRCQGPYGHPEDVADCLDPITRTYPAAIWLNPAPQAHWGYSHSTKMIRDLMNDRMYPLTIEGIDAAMRELTRKR